MYISIYIYMELSWNSGTPKSSTSIGFSFINHPFFEVPPFQETIIHLYVYIRIYIMISILPTHSPCFFCFQGRTKDIPSHVMSLSPLWMRTVSPRWSKVGASRAKQKAEKKRPWPWMNWDNGWTMDIHNQFLYPPVSISRSIEVLDGVWWIWWIWWIWRIWRIWI